MYKRIVVKLGTSVLTAGTPRLNRPQMVEIARQCGLLHAAGVEVIVCSSGAIAAGRERLGNPKGAATVTHKQMFAAVGQSRLMLMWERFFEIYGLHVGQMLLTRADVESRRRYLNARDTLHMLLDNRIVPIINENDAVATDEIKVGDNDNLSALVATVAEADLLLLLTDQPGLFTADPRAHADAQLIPLVAEIDAHVRQLAGGSVSGLGVGGMQTKLDSAEIATRAGTDVVIAAGREPNVILRLAAGEQLGTKFPARESALDNRKRWILAGSRPSGQVVIDGGAVRALKRRGRSLLPAGIVRVEGEFSRGDTVRIVDTDGQRIGRGIVRYSWADMGKLVGVHSAEIETILGYSYGSVAIHRNDMILI